MASKAKIDPSKHKIALDAFNALRGRCPWSSIRRLMGDQELRIGTGWDSLEIALNGEDELAAELVEILPAAYWQYLTVGERYLQIYAFAEKQVTGLLTQAKALKPTGSSFSTIFPFPIVESALQSASEEPLLVHIEEMGARAVALFFCSRRSYESRIRYTPDEMSANLIKALPGFDEFIAIKRVHYQAFDVIVLKGGLERIELRLDHPKHLHAVDASQAMTRLIVALSAALPDAALLVGQSNAENFFPAISSMYEDNKEGIVIDLRFQTHTASLKQEKMKKRNEDLRSERFHRGGKSAVKTINPFHLCIGWTDIATNEDRIELTLPGRARDLSYPTPVLDHAIVSNVVSEMELESVVNRLMKHL